MGIEVAEQLSSKTKLAVVWHKEYITYLAQSVALNAGGNVAVLGTVEPALN